MARTPYEIALDCFHAGSMSQGGKTIHPGTVERWTKEIEAYAEERVKEAMLEYKFGGFSDKGLDEYIENVQAEKARRNKLQTNGDLVRGAK